MQLKHNKLSSLISHTFATQSLGLFISFAIGIFFNRLLGPEGKGFITLIETYVSLSILLIGFSFPNAVIYLIKNKNFSTKDVLIQSLLILILSTIIAFFTFFYFEELFFIEAAPYKELFIYILFVLFVNLFYNDVLLGILNAHNLFKQVNYLNLIHLSISLTIYLTFYTNYISDFQTILSSFIALQFIKTIGYLFLVIKNKGLMNWNQTKVASAQFHSIYIYLSSIYFSNLLNFFNYKIDIFFLNKYYSTKEIGSYALSVGLAQMLWILSSAAIPVLHTFFSDTTIKLKVKAIKLASINRIVFTLGITLSIIGIIISPHLIPMLFGIEFQKSVIPFQILIIAITLSNSTKFIATFNLSLNKNMYNFYATVFGLIVTILLNFLLIPKFGIIGASIATVSSYFTILLTVLIFSYKIHNLSLFNLFIIKKQDLKINL